MEFKDFPVEKKVELFKRILIILACENKELTFFNIYDSYCEVWGKMTSMRNIAVALNVLIEKRIVDFDTVNLTYKFLK